MQLTDSVFKALRRLQSHSPLILTAAISFTVGLLVHSLQSRHSPLLLPSPLSTQLPYLSKKQKSDLPYPPDVLPGARDISTPYGSIRVYEWGPTDGKKVLLVHGVSTPSIALAGIANGLVEKGCRVMIFDLFGRGYTDNPADLPHDKRLYATEILLALASSPLSWTGSSSGKFAIAGFSLGGAIAAAFASYFPQLVSSLILLAPSGLVRAYRFTTRNRILYSSGVIPERLLKYLVKKRLKQRLSAAKATEPKIKSAPEGPFAGELQEKGNSFDEAAGKAVAWQIENHIGFLAAFMSSIRYAPVKEQHDDWMRIGERLTAQKNEAAVKESKALVGGPSSGLREGKVLVIAGDMDDSIIKEEIFEDAEKVFEGNVVLKSVNAGHEFPLSNPEEVVGIIWEFWESATAQGGS